MILHRIFDKPRGFWTGEPVLGLALELRVADKDRQHHLRAREDVLGLYAVRLLLPPQCAEAANPLGQRAPKAGFMRAAIRSEENTTELQSLMLRSYAVFCLK